MNALTARLFEVAHVRESLVDGGTATVEKFIRSMMAADGVAPDEKVDNLITCFQDKMEAGADVFLDRLGSVCEEHISSEDMELMIAHHESEAGKRIYAASKVMHGVVEAMGAKWGQEMMQEALKEQGLL